MSVGYKNPPKANRFKEGQCGNPDGQPKQAIQQLPTAYLFRMVATEEVTIEVNGAAILWVDNYRVGEEPGPARRNEVLSGESSPVRRSGIRRRTELHGDGSRANRVPRSDQARPLA